MISAPVLAAVERGGEWELPSLNHLFVFPDMPGTENWGVFSLNRVSLMLLFSALALATFFFLATRKGAMVPGRLQSVGESYVEFIRKLATDVIGHDGLKFVPFLGTLFVFIFLNNMFKITPFIMLPPTGRLHIPAFLAILVWLVYVGVGIKYQGFVGYFKEVLFPPGVPWPLYILLTPIEILSNLIFRPVTLTFRLFANMVAGHILVVITLITIHVFFVVGPGLPISIFALIISPLVFAFELFVIGLQAYIFVMLTAVYISTSMHAHHEDEPVPVP
ncbi:MAG TPA: F0F1 ATP synthase subunit A [Egibacteraceae bacterium]|nr:F0F1 ATP synthase subunit A [Egibacteraceae bacterium]